MHKKASSLFSVLFLLSFCSTTVLAQGFKDSTTIQVHPSYNKVTGVHLWLFGNNYRQEWATPVKLPLIRISEVYGGLKPLQLGGGMQSKSLRLADKSGKEWVIRSVEKTPDKLLPENLRGTFALDWVDDAMSAQHPFSALVVPPLAEAAGVYHSNPVIGVVAADKALGEYSKTFTGMVVLLEEREPAGESDNTPKMLKELNEDHDNHFDKIQFLRARMLDLLLGDWDRHEDQWRWVSHKENKDKIYQAVPRDRDQVFHVNQGVFPTIAALPWVDPQLGNFSGNIPHVKYSLFKTRFLKGYPDANMSYDEWMHIAAEFVKSETDQVLEAGLKRLPKEVYQMRHEELIGKLKQRRDNIPAAMSQYYYFINRIVDIRTSDKNELIQITDAPDKGMHVMIQKLNKSGQLKDSLMDMTYLPKITKEIRLYISDGDSVVNTSTAKIKLRITGKDSTGFIPTNPYNIWMPLATAAINADDGFLLGLGFKYIGKSGFRKLPYATVQQLMVSHSFATSAFRIRYSGEWIHAIGKADFILQGFMQAPDNTTNFFGQGNQTPLDKSEGFRTFYRTRFDTYQVDPALRWQTGKGTSISAGASFQFYHTNPEENAGRFIQTMAAVNSYDSLTLNQDKTHLGLVVNFKSNQRNSDVLPSEGYFFNVQLQAYTGLNQYTKSFMQIRPEFTWYQKLNEKATIVVSDRVGGGISAGHPAFYQSMFLGGQGNLLGYLQNRFAGKHMAYNNLQARVKLANIASYILPGQLGITGFFDTGRVWEDGENSDQWHTGTGGGLYFTPASLTIVQLLAGHSKEGWYPYISLNFRL